MSLLRGYGLCGANIYVIIIIYSTGAVKYQDLCQQFSKVIIDCVTTIHRQFFSMEISDIGNRATSVEEKIIS